MTNDKLIRTRAMLRSHLSQWYRIPPKAQNQIAHFVVEDRIRQRDAIMLELGHHPRAPDDNPVAGGSPI